MVVHQDQARRPENDGIAEDLAGMDEGCIEDAPRHLSLADRDVLGVEQQNVEFFVREVGQSGRKDVVHIARPRYGVLVARARGPHALAQFDRRDDPRGHGGAYSGDADQNARIDPSQVPKPSPGQVEYPLGQTVRGHRRASGTDHQREKLLLGEGSGPVALKALTGPRLRGRSCRYPA